MRVYVPWKQTDTHEAMQKVAFVRLLKELEVFASSTNVSNETTSPVTGK